MPVKEQLTIFDAPTVSDNLLVLPYVPAPVPKSLTKPLPPSDRPFSHHIGLTHIRLCGARITRTRYYHQNHLTEWQVDGLTARLCPQCVAKWRQQRSAKPVSAATALACPIQPMQCVRVWRNVKGEWWDMGCTTLVKAVHKVCGTNSSLCCFPIDESGVPIHPVRGVNSGN